MPDRAEYVGLMLGDGCVSGDVATLTVDKELEWAVAEKAASVVNGFERTTHKAGIAVTERATSAAVATAAEAVTAFLRQYAVLDAGSAGKRLADRALRLDRDSDRRPPPGPLHRRRDRRRQRREEPVRRARLDERGAPPAGPDAPPLVRDQEQALPRPPPHRPRAPPRRARWAQGVRRGADAQPADHAVQPDALPAGDRVHAREREGRGAPCSQRPRPHLPRPPH